MKKLYAVCLSLLSAFSFAQAQTLIPVTDELVLPQYAYYGGTSISNTNRLPFVVRLKLSGLTANTTYRYMVGLSNNPSLTTQAPGPMYRINNGSGTAGFITGYTAVKAINSSELIGDTLITSGVSRHAKFTTDAAGEYTGWFATVPIGTAAAAGQQPNGGDVYFYINVGLTTSITQTFRTTSTIKLLDYSSVAGSSGCTGLIGTSDVGNERMVAIYDNEAGTGRPLYSTFTENNNNTVTGNLNEGNIWVNPVLYPAVDGVSGSWAAIIPNSLTGGVKAINFYNTDGTLVPLSNAPAANTSTDGKWNGVATASPAGDSTAPIVINSIQGAAQLPVTLVSFKGQVVKEAVKLLWATANEINNKQFEVYRAGRDGSFLLIGKVNAVANPVSLNKYEFTDQQPLHGANYYQLKQVDKDGTAKMHKTILVNAAQQKQVLRMVAQSSEEIVLAIQATENGTGTVSFTDMQGRVLYSRQVALQAGDNMIRIPVQGMAKQMGVISIMSPNAERATLKVVQ
ncbi:MAG: hypothetical protein IT252_04990 [Chitinophagaceae bacterium]|nr:hypothetical protein [Chitinophagaceae bacterium]